MEVGSRPPALAPPPGDPASETPGVVVLGRAECENLLRQHSLGRIGFVVDGWPVVLPVNYVLDGDDIVLRTDPATKLAAGTHWSVPVVLEVDAALTFFEPGWSVLADGIAVEVRAEKELRRLQGLGLEPWAAGPRNQWIRIRVVQVTGRRLTGEHRFPESWHRRPTGSRSGRPAAENVIRPATCRAAGRSATPAAPTERDANTATACT